MSDDIKKIMDDVNAIREKAEQAGTDSAEFKEFQSKAEASLDASEKKNAEIVAQAAQDRKDLDVLQQQYKDLEVEMARKSKSSGVDYKETDEYKALNMFASKGFDQLDGETKALLRTDSDTAGGYLTSSEMDRNIIKKVTEISPIRQLARVRTISKKTMEFIDRTSILEATYEGETAEADDSVSSYGTQTITTSALTVNVPFTYDMILAGDFDIENEIMQDVAESFAKKEGNKFTLGDGVNEPSGFLTNASIIAGAQTSESSTTVTGDDLIRLTGELKEGYNPLFGFNRRTLAHLRTLKGANGQYIWQSGLGGDAPNLIAGEAYSVINDMPAYGTAGNMSVIYGDFMRGYTIVDRTGLSFVRDEVTQKKKRVIELCFHKYNTGKVTLPEAFVALKTKA